MDKTAKQIKKELAYLFKKINWKESHLDAKAIEIMNTVGKDIDDLEAKLNKVSGLHGELFQFLQSVKMFLLAASPSVIQRRKSEVWSEACKLIKSHGGK